MKAFLVGVMVCALAAAIAWLYHKTSTDQWFGDAVCLCICAAFVLGGVWAIGSLTLYIFGY